MWMICGMVSVALCIAGWIMTLKKANKALYASVCSLAFTSLTLLMEYRMVLNWVRKEDFSALMDVVPPMFPVLTGYVMIMLLFNIIPIISAKKHR